jgi:DNA-binding CsgD family transcriptional regulator
MTNVSENQSRISAFLDTLAEQWPSLSHLGYGFWMAFVFLTFRSYELTRNFVGAELSYVYNLQLVIALPAAVTLLFFAINWRRTKALFTKRKFLVLFSCLASLGLLVLPFASSNYVLFVAMAFLVGIGTAVICLEVGIIYSEAGFQPSIINAAISIVVAMFLYFCGIGLPIFMRTLFIASLPVAAALIMLTNHSFRSSRCPDAPDAPDARCPDARCPDAAPKEGSKNPRRPTSFFLRLIIAITVLAFVSGTISGNSTAGINLEQFSQNQTFIMFGIGTVALLMAVFISSGKNVDRIPLLYMVFMTAEIILLIVYLYAHQVPPLAGIAKECLRVFFVCLLACYAFKFEESPVKIFGLGQAAWLGSHVFGWVVGYNLLSDIESRQVVLTIGGVILIVVTMTFIFSRSTIRSLSSEHEQVFRAINGAEKKDDTQEFLLGKGLSRREIEISLLFLRGYSANWISDELSISESTVRSHLHTIYSKLNVHSRQEFKELFGTE